MLTNLLLVSILLVLNGIFAMSEIAIVSSRRARLLQLVEAGSVGARHALELGAEPTRFLSSVQVGITSIGILSGAIGEASFARRLAASFQQVPVLAPYADTLALGLMVIGLTYASLIVGELVPKRLALTHPERIASLIARPMQVLAVAGRPLVYLLSVSTDAILRLCRVHQVHQPAVTVEEIKVLLEQGTEEGIFERSEHDMVTNVLDLDERQVGAVLTPRADVVFLDLQDTTEVNRAKLRDDRHTVLPLCDGGLDRVRGVVRSTRVLAQLLDTGAFDLAGLAETALFVPETMTLLKLLEQFRRTHLPVALVVDEFGGVAGLASLTDVVSAIVGDLPSEAGEDAAIVRREDGSWLMDGGLGLDAVARALDADAIASDEDRQHYHTLGGLAMHALGRVPKIADAFERGHYRFEIVDMDAHRVDRVLVTRVARSAGTAVAPPSAGPSDR